MGNPIRHLLLDLLANTTIANAATRIHHRHIPTPLLYKNNRKDRSHDDDDCKTQQEPTILFVSHDNSEIKWDTRYNTGKNNQRKTLPAYPKFGDQFTQSDREHSPGRHCHQDCDRRQ